jgi:hypothetical protein
MVIDLDQKIIVPEPTMVDDTWSDTFTSQVDDVDDDGFVWFMDDNYEQHKIHKSRLN